METEWGGSGARAALGRTINGLLGMLNAIGIYGICATTRVACRAVC